MNPGVMDGGCGGGSGAGLWHPDWIPTNGGRYMGFTNMPTTSQYPGTTSVYGNPGTGWIGPSNTDSPNRVCGGGGGGLNGSGPIPSGDGGSARPFSSFPGPHFAAPNSPTGSAMPTDWQSAVGPTGLFGGGGGGGNRNPTNYGEAPYPGAGRGGYGNTNDAPGHGQNGLANTGSGGGGDDGTGDKAGLGAKGIVIVHFKV